MNRFLKYWLPLYLYAGIIFYVSNVSKPLPDISIPNIDKLLHIIEYAVFGVLAGRAFKNSQRETLRSNFKILAILLAVAYGASDEFHQFFVSFRECNIFDIAADTVGGTIGAILYGKYHPF